MKRLDQLMVAGNDRHPREVHELILAGEVEVDGKPVKDASKRFSEFCRIEVAGQVVYERVARYLALNKPAGYVSATKDAEHPTVLDLVTDGVAGDLHLVGRLDRFTTGLLLLTNDSRWSRALTDPKKAVPKTYLVGTEREIPEQLIRKFAEGVALPGDGVWTRPSQLELLGSTSCRLTLYEGRHHQIKRMFALWKIKVTALHRERVGDYFLAPDHALGAVREVEPLVGCR